MAWAIYSVKNIIVVVVLLSYVSSTLGCHIPGHTNKRAISLAASVEMTDVQRIRNFFIPCVNDVFGDVSLDFSGIVKFLTDHSLWYDVTQRLECGENNDTVECWSERLADVLTRGSKELAVAQECVERYKGFVIDGQYNPTPLVYNKFDRVRSEDLLNCPTRTPRKFDLCVNDQFAKDEIENPIGNFDSVIGFVQRKMKCSDCDCGKVLEADSDFASFFVDEGLQCDSCWSTRMAALVKSQSTLSETTQKCAATTNDEIILKDEKLIV